MIRISKLADYSVVVLVRLGAGGIETAPGIDLQTHVLDRLPFRPAIADLRPMPATAFQESP